MWGNTIPMESHGSYFAPTSSPFSSLLTGWSFFLIFPSHPHHHHICTTLQCSQVVLCLHLMLCRANWRHLPEHDLLPSGALTMLSPPPGMLDQTLLPPSKEDSSVTFPPPVIYRHIFSWDPSASITLHYKDHSAFSRGAVIVYVCAYLPTHIVFEVRDTDCSPCLDFA